MLLRFFSNPELDDVIPLTGPVDGNQMIVRKGYEGPLAEELQELALSHLEDNEPLVRLVMCCLGSVSVEHEQLTSIVI